MPGIVAIITKRPKVQVVPQLARMVESLCHEPSYTSGTWLDESAGVYMGWAARQGSCSDKTPLRNEQGNITLAFSGE
jgi:asparagine synthase (glutamine-hydrolysing)